MATVILDWKHLKKILPYSRQHIKRLEDENKFPQRVQLSDHRVGWVAEEVEGWIQARIQKRNSLAGDTIRAPHKDAVFRPRSG